MLIAGKFFEGEFFGGGFFGAISVRAIVRELDTRGVGGMGLQKFFYAVTFFGDDVPEEVAIQRQLEIEVEMPNDFTIPDLRSAIVANVQEMAGEQGLSITDADVITQTGAAA